MEFQPKQVVLVEYEPGLFRKATIADLAAYRGQERIIVKGMTARFDTDGNEAGRWGYFKRKLHPFDESKLAATKSERERRKLAERFNAIDWRGFTLVQLQAVAATLPADQWGEAPKKETY